MGVALTDFDPIQFTLLNWCLWAVALLITIIRVVVKYRYRKRLFWDDALAISAMVWLTIMATLNQLSRDAIYLTGTLAEGQTPAAPFATPEEISTALISQKKMQFCFMIFFWSCLWSVKGSLLMLYRRLFTAVDGYMKWWWAVVACCILTWLTSVLTNFMDCMPLARRFSLDPNFTCTVSSGISAIWVATIVDVATDILVGVLPIRLLIGLRISFKQKLGVGAIFSLGIVIVFFAIIRLVQLLQALNADNFKGDISLALWSILECSVAVVVGSLPVLKYLTTRRGDTDHCSRPKHTSQTMKVGTSSSQTANGIYVHLNDMPCSGVRSTVRGGYESHETLPIHNESGKIWITTKQEIDISSQDTGRLNSMERLYHAR